ncbi:unnamed protein product, partial [Nesidiocoris tenuis]
VVLFQGFSTSHPLSTVGDSRLPRLRTSWVLSCYKRRLQVVRYGQCCCRYRKSRTRQISQRGDQDRDETSPIVSLIRSSRLYC